METRDIVERLRDGGNDICRDGPMWPGDDMLEAADELSRLRAENERLRTAMRRIAPYLRWTVGEESPGYHPTMPSAVSAFLAALEGGE